MHVFNWRVIFQSFGIVAGKISDIREILVGVRGSFGGKPEDLLRNFNEIFTEEFEIILLKILKNINKILGRL